MSQPLIAARNAPLRGHRARPEEGGADRPSLRVVAPPARVRLRVPLPVACVVALTLGLFGLLMTNIGIAGDAYRITDLQDRSQHLANSQQAAAEALAAAAAPAELAKRAGELGMVPAPSTVHLAAGGTLGEATPAQAPAPAVPAPGSTDPADPAVTAGTGAAAAQPGTEVETDAPAGDATGTTATGPTAPDATADANPQVEVEVGSGR
ncbi:hypothetical protein ACFFKU_06320 [Kineococcus gynurae]|uniref:Cell division protein FtsL n=1 Tax=Kineococcus gynurae TaxID=452979 RepID=A0ABV5LXU4_9ACTN